MYQLIRQRRKSVTIHVEDNLDVIVKAPHNISQKEIDQIVMKHEEWIQKTIKEKKALAIQKDWFMNQEILYLGKKVPIVITEDPEAKANVCLEQGVFMITTPNKKDRFLIKKQLETYTKQQALSLFTVLTEKYCSLLGCDYHTLSIRKQKTRWGSCSSKGALSYNIRLMSAPIEAIEYVVLHEVMHLIHFNHSPLFWQAIAKIMPGYKKWQQYLKEQGNVLDI